MTPITDPELLRQLESGSGGSPQPTGNVPMAQEQNISQAPLPVQEAPTEDRGFFGNISNAFTRGRTELASGLFGAAAARQADLAQKAGQTQEGEVTKQSYHDRELARKLREHGEKNQRYAVENWRDIRGLGDLGTFVAEQTASGLPTMAGDLAFGATSYGPTTGSIYAEQEGAGNTDIARTAGTAAAALGLIPYGKPFATVGKTALGRMAETVATGAIGAGASGAAYEMGRRQELAVDPQNLLDYAVTGGLVSGGIRAPMEIAPAVRSFAGRNDRNIREAGGNPALTERDQVEAMRNLHRDEELNSLVGKDLTPEQREALVTERAQVNENIGPSAFYKAFGDLKDAGVDISPEAMRDIGVKRGLSELSDDYGSAAAMMGLTEGDIRSAARRRKISGASALGDLDFGSRVFSPEELATARRNGKKAQAQDVSAFEDVVNQLNDSIQELKLRQDMGEIDPAASISQQRNLRNMMNDANAIVKAMRDTASDRSLIYDAIGQRAENLSRQLDTYGFTVGDKGFNPAMNAASFIYKDKMLANQDPAYRYGIEDYASQPATIGKVAKPVVALKTFGATELPGIIARSREGKARARMAQDFEGLRAIARDSDAQNRVMAARAPEEPTPPPADVAPEPTPDVPPVAPEQTVTPEPVVTPEMTQPAPDGGVSPVQAEVLRNKGWSDAQIAEVNSEQAARFISRAEEQAALQSLASMEYARTPEPTVVEPTVVPEPAPVVRDPSDLQALATGEPTPAAPAPNAPAPRGLDAVLGAAIRETETIRNRAAQVERQALEERARRAGVPEDQIANIRDAGEITELAQRAREEARNAQAEKAKTEAEEVKAGIRDEAAKNITTQNEHISGLASKYGLDQFVMDDLTSPYIDPVTGSMRQLTNSEKASLIKAMQRERDALAKGAETPEETVARKAEDDAVNQIYAQHENLMDFADSLGIPKEQALQVVEAQTFGSTAPLTQKELRATANKLLQRGDRLKKEQASAEQKRLKETQRAEERLQRDSHAEEIAAFKAREKELLDAARVKRDEAKAQAKDEAAREKADMAWEREQRKLAAEYQKMHDKQEAADKALRDKQAKEEKALQDKQKREQAAEQKRKEAHERKLEILEKKATQLDAPIKALKEQVKSLEETAAQTRASLDEIIARNTPEEVAAIADSLKADIATASNAMLKQIQNFGKKAINAGKASESVTDVMTQAKTMGDVLGAIEYRRSKGYDKMVNGANGLYTMDMRNQIKAVFGKGETTNYMGPANQRAIASAYGLYDPERAPKVYNSLEDYKQALRADESPIAKAMMDEPVQKPVVMAEEDFAAPVREEPVVTEPQPEPTPTPEAPVENMLDAMQDMPTEQVKQVVDTAAEALDGKALESDPEIKVVNPYELAEGVDSPEVAFDKGYEYAMVDPDKETIVRYARNEKSANALAKKLGLSAIGLTSMFAGSAYAGGMMSAYGDVLGQRESGGKYDIENTLGYVGKYQFGWPALVDLGIIKSQGRVGRGQKSILNEKSNWTGKYGVNSKEEFLNSPEAQEKAFEDWNKMLDRRTKNMGLDQYIGQTIDGVPVTMEGIRASAHLLGHGAVKKALQSRNLRATDAYGTNLAEYMNLGGSVAGMA
ncbi:hypothetical protein [Escherichia phage PJNS034]